ncbi:thrombospondin type 3 repeat-containing protein [Pendulispora brunnea]|uniref:Thrombospondin type 3 repeat-containing protein n=1 Tax=Pendulispora brunnea TaxID=2905690 RepID=A0ABZ2K3Q9_9BACT
MLESRFSPIFPASLGLFLIVGAVACSKGPDGANQDGPGTSEDLDGDGVVNARDNCPGVRNADQADRDLDRIGDACDCDPGDAQLASYRMAAGPENFSPPAGFVREHWTLSDGALLQSRLAAGASDVAFLKGGPMSEVWARVTSASTEIDNFGGKNLRQIFLLFGASVDASPGHAFEAEGCGIEVDSAQNPQTQLSVLRFGGSADAITITPLARVSRAPVNVKEVFQLEMNVRAGAIACSLTFGDGGTVSVSATGLSAVQGSVGLLTRETKARFTELRVCRYDQ